MSAAGGPIDPADIEAVVNSQDWEIANTEVTLEEDGLRLTLELTPLREGATGGTLEVMIRPF
jgi:hypothetical protein